MSIDLVAACLWLDLPPARKLVLLALCERANLETGYCLPGRDEIAMRASLTVRRTSPHLVALKDTGYIKRLGPKPWREGQAQKRWLDVDKILTEGESRRQWLQEQRALARAQRALLEVAQAEDEDQAVFDFAADVLAEPCDDASLPHVTLEAEDVSSLGKQGTLGDEAGDVGGIQQGTIAALAGDAASPVTVTVDRHKNRHVDLTTTDAGEPVFSDISGSTSPASALGARAKESLRRRVTEANYSAWVERAGFEAHGETLYVIAPAELSADWLRTRLNNVLQAAAADVGLTGGVQVFAAGEFPPP